jgi:hypothetical protein
VLEALELLVYAKARGGRDRQWHLKVFAAADLLLVVAGLF